MTTPPPGKRPRFTPTAFAARARAALRAPQSSARFVGVTGGCLAGVSGAAIVAGEPHTGVFWITVACTLIAAFTLALQFHANAPSYAARVVATYQLMVCVALSFITLGNPRISVPATQINLDLTQGWREYATALLVPLIVPLWVGVRALRDRAGAGPVREDEPGTALFLIGACPFVFGRIANPWLPPLLAYVFQVANAGLGPLSFFAGKAALRNRPVLVVWALGLLANGAINLMLGSRGSALIPLFLFGLGMIFAMRSRARRIALGLTIAASIPGVYLIGILGMVRDEIGRDDAQLVSSQTATRIAEIGRQSAAAQGTMLHSDALSSGMERVVPWTNVVVPLLSPHVVPFRGAAGLSSELVASLQLFGTSENAVRDALAANIGAAPANDYGFLVTETTSVEWGVLAEGWSRFGAAGAAVALTLVVGVIVLLEAGIRRAKLTPHARLLGFSVIMVAAMRLFANPLLDVMRFLGLYAVAFVPLMLVLSHSGPVRRRIRK